MSIRDHCPWQPFKSTNIIYYKICGGCNMLEYNCICNRVEYGTPSFINLPYIKMSTKISPQETPAFTRCLVKLDMSIDLTEITILEWSAGGRVKVRFEASGNTNWYDNNELPDLIEILPFIAS